MINIKNQFSKASKIPKQSLRHAYCTKVQQWTALILKIAKGSQEIEKMA